MIKKRKNIVQPQEVIRIKLYKFFELYSTILYLMLILKIFFGKKIVDHHFDDPPDELPKKILLSKKNI